MTLNELLPSLMTKCALTPMARQWHDVIHAAGQFDPQGSRHGDDNTAPAVRRQAPTTNDGLTACTDPMH